MSTALILRQLPSPTGPITIRQRATDGYICVTDICQAAGKLFGGWRRIDRTEEYLQELSRSMQIPIDLLLITITTGPNNTRGTWAHPRIALRVAQWCSPRFEVAVDTWLEEWLTRAKTTTQELLSYYLVDKPRPWESRFERTFYRELYRVWGKLDDFPADGTSHWGLWTAPLLNRMIYDRHFPPFVMAALRERNPRVPSGGRRRRHMQLLAEDLGDRELQLAVAFTLKFLKLAQTPQHFWAMLDLVAPRSQTALPFVETLAAEGFGRKRPQEVP
jgi:hypothetical protein